MQKSTWQAWSADDSVTFAPVGRIGSLRDDGTIPDNAVLLHELVACTGEDAMAQHHQKMGWEPYRPLGEAAPCPNACGENYYPDGYGECPNCGRVRLRVGGEAAVETDSKTSGSLTSRQRLVGWSRFLGFLIGLIVISTSLVQVYEHWEPAGADKISYAISLFVDQLWPRLVGGVCIGAVFLAVAMLARLRPPWFEVD